MGEEMPCNHTIILDIGIIVAELKGLAILRDSGGVVDGHLGPE